MIGDFSVRSTETERLDRGEFTQAEFRRWQKEMWFIHRFFGEARAINKTLISEMTGSGLSKCSILDVAAGSGSILIHARRKLAGKHVTYFGLESSVDSARTIRDNGIISVQASALKLPFADRSIDFVFCTLFLHHLDRSEASDLLAEMGRVARKKFFVVDLDRRAIAYWAYRFFGRLVLQRFTLDDGSLSIRRAYRTEELREIAVGAGLKKFAVERSAINRLILSASVS